MAFTNTTVVYAIFINGIEAPNSRFIGTLSSTDLFTTTTVGQEYITTMTTGIATLSLVAGDVITVRNMSNGASIISGGSSDPPEPSGTKMGASLNIRKVS